MDVRIEEVSAVEKKLVVDVPWETVSTRLTDAYKDLAKGVQLKGFRKGKVPRSVLERMFGPRVRAEVTFQLLQESFVTAATEHDLDAVAEPRLDGSPDIKKGQPLRLEAIVEVKGEVVASDYDDMELKKRRLEVTDEQVEQAIAELRREHTELVPIEERDVTASSDVVAVKVQGVVGEHEIDRPAIMVDLGDDEREPLPGLAKALTGLPLASVDHVLELPIPEDHSDSSIAGHTAKLTISITDARQKDVPELDDEFAKDTGKGETIDELRAKVREDLEGEQRKRITAELREAALRELVKRNQIAIAPALVERAVEFQWKRLQSMLGMQGGSSGLDSRMRESLRPRAADDVRGQLLLEAIADKETLTVSEEELAAHIEELAAEGGKQAARLRAELDRDGRLDNIRFQLRQERTLDHIIGKARVEEVDASELEPAHDHEHHDHEHGDHEHHAHEHDHPHEHEHADDSREAGKTPEG